MCKDARKASQSCSAAAPRACIVDLQAPTSVARQAPRDCPRVQVDPARHVVHIRKPRLPHEPLRDVPGPDPVVAQHDRLNRGIERAHERGGPASSGGGQHRGERRCWPQARSGRKNSRVPARTHHSRKSDVGYSLKPGRLQISLRAAPQQSASAHMDSATSCRRAVAPSCAGCPCAHHSCCSRTSISWTPADGPSMSFTDRSSTLISFTPGGAGLRRGSSAVVRSGAAGVLQLRGSLSQRTALIRPGRGGGRSGFSRCLPARRRRGAQTPLPRKQGPAGGGSLRLALGWWGGNCNKHTETTQEACREPQRGSFDARAGP